MKKQTLKDIDKAIHYILTVISVFMVAYIFTVAAWGWLVLNIYSPFRFVLMGWAILFFYFSLLVFSLWYNLALKFKNDRNNT